MQDYEDLYGATDNVGAVALALDIASGAIRRFCGWSLSQETVTDALVDGLGRATLFLPTLRLTSVVAVAELGATGVFGASLVYDTDYTWTRDGRLIRAGRWPSSARAVRVTYTHGYPSAELADVRGICLAMASRHVSSPSGYPLRSGSLDDFSFTVAGSADEIGPQLSGAERTVLSGMRLPAVA